MTHTGNGNIRTTHSRVKRETPGAVDVQPRPCSAALRGSTFQHTCIFEEVIYGKGLVCVSKNVNFPFHGTIPLPFNRSLPTQARRGTVPKRLLSASKVVTLEAFFFTLYPFVFIRVIKTRSEVRQWSMSQVRWASSSRTHFNKFQFL